MAAPAAPAGQQAVQKDFSNRIPRASIAESSVDSQTYMEHSESSLLAKRLKVFRDFDASGDGSISLSEFGAALKKLSGAQVPEETIAKLAASLDADNDGELSFAEFEQLAKQLSGPTERSRRKTRAPRLWLVPEQFDLYSSVFRSASSDEGTVGESELQDLFTRCSMQVAPERLKQILAEVDDDSNGTLDEVEFMMLIIKAAGMKKRRVGPGLCPLSSLQEEGWSPQEMRKAGFEYKDFVEEGFAIEELLDSFSARELRKAGLTLAELLAVGWNCAGAREAGFELAEMAAAGCSPQRIRFAGWDDPSAASQMRQLGVQATDMRLGGWTLSELRLAGYSLTDLRLAGFSPTSLGTLAQHVRPAPGRRTTFAIRDTLSQQG